MWLKKGEEEEKLPAQEVVEGDQLRQKENQTVQFSGNKVAKDFQMEEIMSNPISQVM